MIENGVRTQSTAFACSLVAGLAALLIAAGASAQPAPDYAAIVAAPDRSDADRQADQRRPPLPFLAFAAAHPGMKVLDMGAGGGYSTELMARAVAPSGVVYAQYPADGSERARTNFEARMKNPAMKNVVLLSAVRRSGTGRPA